jgi:subtilase family serine protease
MKQRYLTLSMSIAAALASAPAMLMAQPSVSGDSASGREAPRITQTINNNVTTTIANTHLAFVARAKTSVNLADTAKMNHLQLVLKPSVLRHAQMEGMIANQHNPKSAQFQKWLTPKQFGDAFGAADRDIAAVTAWLISQGFTVNNVYPNKTQIDFSGTVAQVRQAFHTQEAIYTIGKEKHLANSSDISIPTALKSVVAGVMGLNDFHPKALLKKPQIAQWNAAKKGFVSKAKDAADAKSGAKVINQAVSFNGGAVRGLAPNDLATMYGVKQLRTNGVTGTGITIALVEDGDMDPNDWANFNTTFNLTQYGGTFQQFNPAAPTGPNNCNDPPLDYFGESPETVLDAEWSTAIAPGANIWVATCSGYSEVDGVPEYPTTTDNFFGGVFLAADNLINNPDPAARPNIISASYGYGEYFVDSASKTAIDLMWAQADAEGISVFVSTGDSGSNPSFNGGLINGYYGNTAVDANAFATSPHVTAVGGTDTADVLDGTTSKYFAPTPSAVGGSALSYVPEIPWNESCGNGVAAKAMGFSTAIDFCKEYLKYDPNGYYATSEAGSGGPSSVDAKPTWQRQVFNSPRDQSRDLPDVSLFAGSYGGYTWVITCTTYYACSPDFSGPTALSGGTSLSSPMFAGIQALMDQGLAARGLSASQGNAAPTLYALAANQYGGLNTPSPSIATCSADNGATGTDNCVFHNVTRGSISSQCFEEQPQFEFTTDNCYFYGNVSQGNVQLGLTTTDASPTAYTVANKAYSAQPGWSFASGLGSVNAKNLLIAWRAFVNAPPAPPAPPPAP